MKLVLVSILLVLSAVNSLKHNSTVTSVAANDKYKVNKKGELVFAHHPSAHFMNSKKGWQLVCHRIFVMVGYYLHKPVHGSHFYSTIPHGYVLQSNTLISHKAMKNLKKNVHKIIKVAKKMVHKRRHISVKKFVRKVVKNVSHLAKKH